MGFDSGSISFRRFAVVGKHPSQIDQKILDKLESHTLQPTEEGIPEEVEYGWIGPRHVFDGTFSFEHNVFAEALFFAMRLDTNRVPGEFKKAYQVMEEDAVAKGNPSGFISKKQKRDVKDVVRRKIDEDLRSGKYRRSKLVPILWDFPTKTLFCAASGATQEKLMELFERSFGLELQPLSSGSIALNLLEAYGKRRDYEDFRPSRFIDGPDGEGQWPDYPWVAKGPEPKDFLGNEFLLWLWHEADAHNGRIKTESGGDLTVFIDKSLDLDCAFGATGKDSLRGTGPAQMVEARDALRSGKVPRKAGFILDINTQPYSFTFNAETFGLGSAKLPDVEEADSPRVLFEERIALLRDLCKSIDTMFDAFLRVRASASWEGQTTAIRRWIIKSSKPVAAVA